MRHASSFCLMSPQLVALVFFIRLETSGIRRIYATTQGLPRHINCQFVELTFFSSYTQHSIFWTTFLEWNLRRLWARWSNHWVGYGFMRMNWTNLVIAFCCWMEGGWRYVSCFNGSIRLGLIGSIECLPSPSPNYHLSHSVILPFIKRLTDTQDARWFLNSLGCFGRLIILDFPLKDAHSQSRLLTEWPTRSVSVPCVHSKKVACFSLRVIVHDLVIWLLHVAAELCWEISGAGSGCVPVALVEGAGDWLVKLGDKDN